MEITVRLTKDAVVNTTKNQKEVVNFSGAENNSYRAKGQTEFIQSTNYYNCSFWKTAKIAGSLKKGMLVQLSGNLSASAYIDGNGEAKADLKFHVDSIKFLAKNTNTTHHQQPQRAEDVTETLEDLPF